MVVSLDTAAPVVEPTTTLVGRVVDRHGWPVRGVVARSGTVEAVTDEHGEYHMVVPAAGARVTLSSPEHDSRTAWLDPAEAPVTVLVPKLPWSEGAAAERPSHDALVGEGFLVDARGDAIQNAVVTVAETGARARSDDTGRYRIALPGDGTATLIAWDGDGRVARSDALRSERARGLVPLPQLELGAGAAVRGLLKDPDGEPLAGAALVVRGEGVQRQVRTNASGMFAVEGLVAGDYVLEALPHRGAPGFRRELACGGTASVDYELVMAWAEPFVVEVVADGEPVADAWVVATEADAYRALARTDAEGVAVFEGVGRGPLSFEVRAADTLAPYEILAFDGASHQLLVRKG